DALDLVDRERRRLLAVERAQPAPVLAAAAELGVCRDDRHDVGGLPHPRDIFVDDAHGRDGTSGPSRRGQWVTAVSSSGSPGAPCGGCGSRLSATSEATMVIVSTTMMMPSDSHVGGWNSSNGHSNCFELQVSIILRPTQPRIAPRP